MIKFCFITVKYFIFFKKRRLCFKKVLFCHCAKAHVNYTEVAETLTSVPWAGRQGSQG
jgi:hypothetical protein